MKSPYPPFHALLPNRRSKKYHCRQLSIIYPIICLVLAFALATLLGSCLRIESGAAAAPAETLPQNHATEASAASSEDSDRKNAESSLRYTTDRQPAGIYAKDANSDGSMAGNPTTAPLAVTEATGPAMSTTAKTTTRPTTTARPAATTTCAPTTAAPTTTPPTTTAPTTAPTTAATTAAAPTVTLRPMTAQETAIADQLLVLLNQYRAENGLSAVGTSGSYSNAAAIRAQEAAVCFSHTRPDGREFYTVLADVGLPMSACGENLAWRNGGVRSDTAALLMGQWKQSAGHNQNMLTPSWENVGIGVHVSADGQQITAAQIFIG